MDVQGKTSQQQVSSSESQHIDNNDTHIDKKSGNDNISESGKEDINENINGNIKYDDNLSGSGNGNLTLNKEMLAANNSNINLKKKKRIKLKKKKEFQLNNLNHEKVEIKSSKSKNNNNLGWISRIYQLIIPNSDNTKKKNVKYFKKSEVAKHADIDDVWMIIHGKVYDVTSIMTTHPGGIECLFGCAGVDATAAFDDVSHSDYAHDMIKPCYLGEILDDDDNDNNVKEDKQSLKKDHNLLGNINNETGINELLLEYSFFIFLSIFGLLLFIYLQMKKWEY